MTISMYCVYVGFDYTYIDINALALNPFWPHKFGFKPLLGLEPMAPIRPQLPAIHATYSATKCMYVCMYVRMYVCMYVCTYVCICVLRMYVIV